MDIAIARKDKLPNVKRYIILAAIAVPVFFAVKYLWNIGQAGFSIDRNALVYGEVKRGKYTVSVRGTGLLVPDNIQWLAAEVDATVVKVILKAGNVVKAGDLIVELANPQLVQQLAEAKWEFEALDSELKAAKVDQESGLQLQKSNELNAKLDYERSVNEFNAHSRLIKTGAVSQLAYDRIRVEMDQSNQRWLSSQEQLAKTRENLSAQNKARAARLKIAKKHEERFQQQVDDLQVKATMDSILLEMPLEAGQRIAMGTNIAKLAQKDSLIAELKVPEIQIRDVAVGQVVVIDTRNSKIEGLVTRVDPAVVGGAVQVDVSFSKGLPDDARPDLSVDGEIKITEIADASYVERPLFAQSRSHIKLYKLTKDGNFAERVEVEVGYGSVNQIQILKGLQVGDKIVTSDPTRFQSYDKFRIK
jgi:HlyD family secretion protein